MKKIRLFLLLLCQISFSQTEVLTPKNIQDFVVTKNATVETLALFYNLKFLSKKGFALGQQDGFTSFNSDGVSDMKVVSGFEPAVLGLDFSNITDDKNTEEEKNWFYKEEQKAIVETKKAYKQGVIITFSWHFKEPYYGESFYTENMNDTQKKAIQSILPGGKNHKYYKKKLDKISFFSKQLVGDNGELIPIIFRPFHEFDGSWFWWGAKYCTPEEYKKLYVFTVDYLRNKGVKNFLYAFSPDNKFSTQDEYLARYPGDDYVDVLGMDNYGDFNNKGELGSKSANSKLKIISDLAKSKMKIAALTEVGYQINKDNKPIDGFYSKLIYSALTDQDIEISYAMFWRNAKDNYFIPKLNKPDTSDFVEFTHKPKVLLSNALPSLYQFNTN